MEISTFRMVRDALDPHYNQQRQAGKYFVLRRLLCISDISMYILSRFTEVISYYGLEELPREVQATSPGKMPGPHRRDLSRIDPSYLVSW